MVDVVDYLRPFRSSVATGKFGSAETEAIPILRRLDAFLSSHLGRFICCGVYEVISSKKESVDCSFLFFIPFHIQLCCCRKSVLRGGG